MDMDDDDVEVGEDFWDDDQEFDHDSDSEDEEMTEDDPTTASSVETNNTENFKYDVLTTGDVIQDMLRTIEDVNKVLEEPVDNVRALLQHCNWDKQKVLEGFYTDKNKMMEEAQLYVSPTKKSEDLMGQEDEANNNNNVTEGYCEICLTTGIPKNEMWSLGCSHKFCKECLTAHLSSQIQNECKIRIPCPDTTCKIIATDKKIRTLVSDLHVIEIYDKLLAKNYVESNREMRWCTSPQGCTNALKAESVDPQEVTCNCGHKFCFKCGLDWHPAVNCDLLQRWNKKFQDDSGNSKWLQANTRDCPKCKVQIEKNGGCNHMNCRKCKLSFCWFCMTPLTSKHQCTRYVPNEKNIASARAYLNRYTFYLDRYLGHSKSLKLESKLNAKVSLKMNALQENQVSWIDVQFLKRAVEVLFKCRQHLLYTYCFAFYLEKCNQTTIFEDNQADLQQTVEELSEILEKDVEDMNELYSMKHNIQDKCTYCEQRLQVLVDHVKEGYQKDWWTYRKD